MAQPASSRSWPGGLVLGGLCTIALANQSDWRLSLGLILIPALVFFFILVSLKFPRSETGNKCFIAVISRCSSELGAFGALVGFGLSILQLGQVFGQVRPGLVVQHFGWTTGEVTDVVWSLTGAVVIVFALINVRSFGRCLLAFLIIIMMPQATTELGTDGWITSLMQTPMQAAGHNPAWVLVYTSAIMMVLRFCAGPLIHKLSPLGLLATCSALAAIGLFALSRTGGAGIFAIFAAATLYGVGKTFFWPTILGLTSEQCPRGGALTLNAVGGIGMLAVGILGAPFIGYLQETSATAQLASANPGMYRTVTVGKTYLLGGYQAIDPVKAAAVTDPGFNDQIKAATTTGQFNALAKMALFPVFIFACYLALILYFKSRGGYKPVQLAVEKKE